MKFSTIFTIAFLFSEYFYVTGEDCSHEDEKWSYKGKKNGPENWKKNYPDCDGQNQSPINIDTKKISSSDLDKLDLKNYDKPVSQAPILNNGHTVQVNIDDGTWRGFVADGTNYTLKQFHFHWGSSKTKGSEHKIDGRQYSIEMHLVHLSDDKKIAVVGVLFKEADKKFAGLDPVISALDDVQVKDAKSNLEQDLQLDKLVTEIPLSFYRYDGSLTTPGCNEGVLWSVAKRIPAIGKKQMQKFRQLKSDSDGECPLVDNFRPVQPLNDREIKESS